MAPRSGTQPFFRFFLTQFRLVPEKHSLFSSLLQSGKRFLPTVAALPQLKLTDKGEQMSTSVIIILTVLFCIIFVLLVDQIKHSNKNKKKELQGNGLPHLKFSFVTKDEIVEYLEEAAEEIANMRIKTKYEAMDDAIFYHLTKIADALYEASWNIEDISEYVYNPNVRMHCVIGRDGILHDSSGAPLE